jgi:hypothetical protein
MNLVKLSGRLSGDVSLGATERGAPMAKSRLKFNLKDDAIPVFAVAEIAEELAQFHEGEEVLITGRLLIRGERRNAIALAVDKVEPIALRAADAKQDIEFFHTMRTHERNAEVKGRR